MRITSVTVENFRSIRSLTVNLEVSPGARSAIYGAIVDMAYVFVRQEVKEVVQRVLLQLPARDAEFFYAAVESAGEKAWAQAVDHLRPLKLPEAFAQVVARLTALLEVSKSRDK